MGSNEIDSGFKGSLISCPRARELDERGVGRIRVGDILLAIVVVLAVLDDAERCFWSRPLITKHCSGFGNNSEHCPWADIISSRPTLEELNTRVSSHPRVTPCRMQPRRRCGGGIALSYARLRSLSA